MCLCSKKANTDRHAADTRLPTVEGPWQPGLALRGKDLKAQNANVAPVQGGPIPTGRTDAKSAWLIWTERKTGRLQPYRHSVRDTGRIAKGEDKSFRTRRKSSADHALGLKRFLAAAAPRLLVLARLTNHQDFSFFPAPFCSCRRISFLPKRPGSRFPGERGAAS